MATVDQDRIDAIYLLYILWQCEAFDDARKCLVKVLDRLAKAKNPNVVEAERRTFAELQSCFTSAANISKLLWPGKPFDPKNGPEGKKRGQRLRAMLNVQKEPVLENKKLRNRLEHIDEHLDSWATSPRDMIVNAVSDNPAINAYNPTDIFGLYNPKTYTVTVLGESVDLDQLCNAVWGVKASAAVAFGRIHRKRYPVNTMKKTPSSVLTPKASRPRKRKR